MARLPIVESRGTLTTTTAEKCKGLACPMVRTGADGKPYCQTTRSLRSVREVRAMFSGDTPNPQVGDDDFLSVGISRKRIPAACPRGYGKN